MANEQNDKSENHKPGPKPGTRKSTTKGRTASKSANGSNGSNGRSQSGKSKATSKSRLKNLSVPEVPAWVGIAASVVGAGLAAGYFAWRNQQNDKSGDNFSAAYADGETDSENFSQTRNAGTSSMRDDHDDWEDIDEMNDASFPASDPPSFNPGTA